MIHLNASTAKIDLIKILEYESDKPQNLYLIIDSLPGFLNTPIAFTVFNYQISRYPRKVFWWSYEPEILEFLKNCTTSVIDPVADKTIKTESNSIIKYTESKPAVIDQLATSNISKFKFSQDKNEDTAKTKNTFSAEKIINDKEFLPLDLIQDNPNNTEDLQDFGSWIKKIEATKEALSSLKNEKFSPEISKYSNISSKKGNKVFRILSLSLAIVLVFAVCVILMPAKVYTIEVGNLSKEEGIDLQLKVKDFAKNSEALAANDSIVPHGKTDVPTDLSTGEVTLINEGNRAVNLDNGLFRLVTNNTKFYQVLADNTLPKSFSIPAKYDTSKVLKFRIQAAGAGEDYNLPINTKLDIVNLQGEGRKVCSSCYAVTTTEIKSLASSGQSIVTDYDQSFVSQNVEAKLAQERADAIKNIQQGKVFTNEDWYKNTSSNYIFNKNIGESTSMLTLDAKVNVDLFYLNQDQIEKLIKEQNQSIKTFKTVSIADTQNNPRNSDTIKIKFFYKYDTENTCLDRQKFLSTLSTKDFEEAKKQILVDCPDIVNIQKKEVGVSIPGIPARVDLNVTTD